MVLHLLMVQVLVLVVYTNIKLYLTWPVLGVEHMEMKLSQVTTLLH